MSYMTNFISQEFLFQFTNLQKEVFFLSNTVKKMKKTSNLQNKRFLSYRREILALKSKLTDKDRENIDNCEEMDHVCVTTPQQQQEMDDVSAKKVTLIEETDLIEKSFHVAQNVT